MSGTPRRRSGATAFVLSIFVFASGLLQAQVARAVTSGPSLRLVVGQNKVTLKRPEGRPAYLDIGAYVASEGGPFELWARRPDYDHPATLWQVVPAPGGGTSTVPLDASLLAPGWRGLSRFFRVTVTNEAGDVVLDRYHPFCPGTGDLARVDDDGPATPTYPQLCSGNPFTLGAVWGIDDGWASSLFGYGSVDRVKGPDGRYTATVSIAPEYVTLFGIDAADATASVQLVVRSTKRQICREICPGDVSGPASSVASRMSVPTDPSPDPSLLPDLVALPAWGISIETDPRSGREFLDFSATVWNAGPAPLVVEGFRAPGQQVMAAWQYVYSNGAPVSRSSAGQLMYDPRRGHQHWHFRQFATYSLLDASQSPVVRSQKESFCLAPTDAIDLTAPGAEWNPYSVGLGTACGYRSSIWTREALPAGWGDTYVQGLPGQSFDITDLPNGTYYIQVVANPTGSLLERNVSNDVEVRRIVLGGRPGNRTVEVPPWNGIDTEAD